MNYRNIVLCGITSLLISCATYTEVIPAGKDTFIITGEAGIEVSSGQTIKSDLYVKANQYCESLGKKLQPYSSASGVNSAELTFRCLDENDPEYKRPELEWTD